MPETWYGDGLRFECTRCGNCCSGTPGSVRVNDAEIAKLAEHLELAIDEFRVIYTRPLRKGDISLREKGNGECVFYRNGAAEGRFRRLFWVHMNELEIVRRVREGIYPVLVDGHPLAGGLRFAHQRFELLDGNLSHHLFSRSF